MKDRPWMSRAASMAVAVALSAPLTMMVVSLDNNSLPTLAFEGTRINMMADGSAQLLFDVVVRNLDRSDGVNFKLDYNGSYLRPSDYTTNEILSTSDDPADAFESRHDLYWVDTNGNSSFDEGEQRDPFMDETNYVGPLGGLYEEDNYISYNESAQTGQLVLARWIRRDEELTKVGNGLTSEDVGENSERYNIFTAAGQKGAVLGTLSFRVTDLSKLPEMEKLFGSIVDREDPKGTDGSRYLLWFGGRFTTVTQGPWMVGAVTGDGANLTHNNLTGYTRLPAWPQKARASFTFYFPKTIIGLELAAPEVTIDAYQAYTNGLVSDVPAAMQKYSPAVVATYTDGTKESFVLPWDGCEVFKLDSYLADPDDDSGWDRVTDASGPNRYTPTSGDYAVRVNDPTFTYTVPDGAGGTTSKTQVFPVPVVGKLHVTPITLVDVTADDLHQVYELNDSLVTPGRAGCVQSVGEMDLPNEARLVTDLPAGGATLTMGIPGWQSAQAGSRWPGNGETMSTLWADGNTDGTIHWPTGTDAGRWNDPEGGATVTDNRKGVYSFHMATGYTAGSTAKNFTRAEIQAKYPWLTVPDNDEVPGKPEEWPLENATRKLVGEGTTKLAANYLVSYDSTETDANGNVQLTLRVERSESTAIDMAPASQFRVRLPDGTEILNGHASKAGSWFVDDTNAPLARSDYDENMIRDTGTNSGYSQNMFQIVTTPGDNGATGDYAAERERLRRDINLGGWFSVSVNETPDDPDSEWTNYIPVYVPPRRNDHIEDKVYNFLGENVGLYPYPANGGQLPVAIVLPEGTYETVDQVGQPEYESDSISGLPTDVRHRESYGAATTYDGETGAEPGDLNVFRIVKKGNTSVGAWTISGPAMVAGLGQVTTYGDDPFRNEAIYGSYGVMYNPNYAKSATIRTQQVNTPDENLREAITLTYEEADRSGIIDDGTNVTETIFSTRQEGYRTRQDYVLTINNVGDVPINGLNVDLATDLIGAPAYMNDGGGGHFVILKPPASFLPVGGSTTFTLSYVYDLDTGGQDAKEYLDKLFITSNTKRSVPGVKGEGYLLDFDARFQVSQGEIHTVTVEVIPDKDVRTGATNPDGSPREVQFPMGTALVVVGGPSGAFSTAAGSTSFREDEDVYILITAYDEYTVKRITTRNEQTGVEVAQFDLNYAVTAPPLGDGQRAMWLKMPDADVTVTVEFEEPISSKLRLGKLKVYAEESVADLKTGPEDTKTPTSYEIWQKGFTQADLDYVTNNMGGQSLLAQGQYLMTRGRAIKEGLTDVYLEPPDKTVEQYLVVLPSGPEGDYAQLEAVMRHVLYTLTADGVSENPDIDVTLRMTLYNHYDANGDIITSANDPGTMPSIIYNPATTGKITNTADDELHVSDAFASPEPGNSFYVRIDMQHIADGATDYTNRYYFIEIHRKPLEAVAQLNYGNSPYGLIMNDDYIDGTAKDSDGLTAKDRAKSAFKGNKYSFSGLAAANVPTVVRTSADTKLKNIHYWSEAWADPGVDVETTDMVYEPESYRGFQAAGTALSTDLWGGTIYYNEGNNLDLDDYSFFAILGEEWEDPGVARAEDSSGREVDLNEHPAQITLSVYTLDTGAATQVLRFDLPHRDDYPDDDAYAAALAARTVKLELGEAKNVPVLKSADWDTGNKPAVPDIPATDTTPAVTGSPAVINNYVLRPGVYQLTYTYRDYDWSETNNSTLSVTRRFAVLAPLGDENADKQVDRANATATLNDVVLIKNRVNDPLGYTAPNYEHAALLRFRCCDVNNDRNINNIDANALAADKPAADKLYLPTNYITRKVS